MQNENTAHKCENCQASVSASAMSCPACGHTIAVRKSKAGAVILAWFLGGFGLHRFYLGDHFAGIAFLAVTAATLIEPIAIVIVTLAAVIDGLQMLFRSPAYYRRVV